MSLPKGVTAFAEHPDGRLWVAATGRTLHVGGFDGKRLGLFGTCKLTRAAKTMAFRRSGELLVGTAEGLVDLYRIEVPADARMATPLPTNPVLTFDQKRALAKVRKTLREGRGWTLFDEETTLKDKVTIELDGGKTKVQIDLDDLLDVFRDFEAARRGFAN